MKPRKRVNQKEFASYFLSSLLILVPNILKPRASTFVVCTVVRQYFTAFPCALCRTRKRQRKVEVFTFCDGRTTEKNRFPRLQTEN